MSFIFFFVDRLYCLFDVELFASQPNGLTVMKMTLAIIATVLWLIHYVLMSWSNIERIFFSLCISFGRVRNVSICMQIL